MQDLNTSEIFYKEKMYPLQNRILNVINESSPSLYLTGGTALSRFYLFHRYSDDLDLFTNADKNFPEEVEKAVKGILGIRGIKLKNSLSGVGEGYIRLEVEDGDVSLTVDFVNDVAFRVGSPQKIDGILVDNVANIMTNKISALIGRDELKDIVDVREICRTFKFDWGKVLDASLNKEASVDSEYIDYKLSNLARFLGNHPDFLESINWIRKPDTNLFISDLMEIRDNAIALTENRLCSESACSLEGLY